MTATRCAVKYQSLPLRSATSREKSCRCQGWGRYCKTAWVVLARVCGRCGGTNKSRFKFCPIEQMNRWSHGCKFWWKITPATSKETRVISGRQVSVQKRCTEMLTLSGSWTFLSISSGNSVPFYSYNNIHYRKDCAVNAILNFLILSSLSHPIYLRHFKHECFLISHLAALRTCHVRINWN